MGCFWLQEIFEFLFLDTLPEEGVDSGGRLRGGGKQRAVNRSGLRSVPLRGSRIGLRIDREPELNSGAARGLKTEMGLFAGRSHRPVPFAFQKLFQGDPQALRLCGLGLGVGNVPLQSLKQFFRCVERLAGLLVLVSLGAVHCQHCTLPFGLQQGQVATVCTVYHIWEQFCTKSVDTDANSG